jgi:hypothetical protein
MARQALVILAVVIAFGILVPIYKGFGFLDARIIAAYACLALLFVAPASAELAGTPGQDAAPSAILARIAIIVAWGWGITVLILATAIVTLNVMARRGGGFLVPPLQFISAVLVFSLSASIAIAMLGAVLARRFSAAGVKNILRTAFLIILLGLAFGSRVLPESVTLQILDRFETRRALTQLAWRLSEASALLAVVLFILLIRSRKAAPFAKIPKTENPAEGGG